MRSVGLVGLPVSPKAVQQRASFGCVILICPSGITEDQLCLANRLASQHGISGPSSGGGIGVVCWVSRMA